MSLNIIQPLSLWILLLPIIFYIVLYKSSLVYIRPTHSILFVFSPLFHIRISFKLNCFQIKLFNFSSILPILNSALPVFWNMLFFHQSLNFLCFSEVIVFFSKYTWFSDRLLLLSHIFGFIFCFFNHFKHSCYNMSNNFVI